MYDLVIRGGTLVTPAETFTADLGIRGGRIAALGRGLAGDHSLDAAGLLVVPGAVDPHVHLQTPVGATQSSDDWASGTRAAACGGTTTLIDFVEPDLGASLLEALAARQAQAEGAAVIDYGLHMTLLKTPPAVLAEIQAVVQAGSHSLQLSRFLERRIDQDQSATFLWRQECADRVPGVDVEHLCAPVAAQGLAKERHIVGMKLAGDQAVVGAHQGEGQRRTSGIEHQMAIRICRADSVEIRGEERGHRVGQRFRVRSQQPADAASPFAGALGLGAVQAIGADARVRVDHAQRLRLLRQAGERTREDRVLQHVCEVAGMEGMAIVHAASFSRGRSAVSSRGVDAKYYSKRAARSLALSVSRSYGFRR